MLPRLPDSRKWIPPPTPEGPHSSRPGKPTPTVSAPLMLLELKKIIRQLPGPHSARLNPYGPTLPSSTRVVSTPVAMSILKMVPAFFFPPRDVVPRKEPWPSLTNAATGPYPL